MKRSLKYPPLNRDPNVSRGMEIERLPRPQTRKNPLPPNKEANIFSEITAGLRPGRIISHRGVKMAVIYEGENGPLYIEANGNTHNIITNGEWTYPVLIDTIPYIKPDGKTSVNIIICKKQVAKNLVYSRVHKLIDVFDSDILDKIRFHLLDRNNSYSYANATMSKFNRENEMLGDNVYVDNSESAASFENLLVKFRSSKHPSLVVYLKKSVVREGKLFCWLAYSLVGLQEAKGLVYFNKNAVNKLNSKKMINRATMTSRSSSHTTGWTYGGRTLRSTSNPILITPKRPSAELIVERMSNPVETARALDRNYVETQAEVRIATDTGMTPAVQERIDIRDGDGEVDIEEVGREGLPWHESSDIVTRDTRRDRLREEIRDRGDDDVEIERHTAPQWEALINQAQKKSEKKAKRLFQTKRNTIEEEQHDREERGSLVDGRIKDRIRKAQIEELAAPQWGGLVNDVKVGRHGAEIHTAPEWGAVANAAREVDLTAYQPFTTDGTDLPEKRNEEDGVEENDEGVDEGAEEEVQVQSGQLEANFLRDAERVRMEQTTNIGENQDVEEVQVQGGHFEIRALGIAKAAPAPNVAEDQDVERGRDVEDGQDREGYYE